MLRVLIYHRVADPDDTPELNPRMVSATPDVFEQQMAFVARNYRVVSMEEVLDAVERRRNLNGKPVLITFDDAYCDFAANAWPVLQQYRLPVTLFVPTAFPDHPERWFWWDKLYHAFVSSAKPEFYAENIGLLPMDTHEHRMQSMKTLQNYIKGIAHSEAMKLVDDICSQLGRKTIARKTVLSWKELRKLAKQGVTLGAHTSTHPIMTRLTPDEIRREIRDSYADLKKELGEVLPIFCYPAGGHDDTVVKILNEEGFELAFTTRKGQNDLRLVDPLRMRRQNITRRTTMPVFRIRLTRWASYLDAWRHRKQYMPMPATP